MSGDPSTNHKSNRVWPWAAGSAVVSAALLMWWPVKPSGGGEHRPTSTAPLAVIDRIALPPGPERQVGEELESAVGGASNLDGTSRLEVLRHQEGALEQIETDLLLSELLHPRQSGEGKGWESEYFHEICSLLQRHPEAREKFARVLASVAADAKRDPRIRDYALQHLRTTWSAATGDQSLRDSIKATFKSLLESHELVPSALLSLHLLGSDFNESSPDVPTSAFVIPDDELTPAVESIFQNPDREVRQVASRMAALRVVSDRKLTGLLPEVRRIAANREGEHAVARMAAIAALGRFGDPNDRPLLESMNDPDPRIEGAVKHALAQIP